MSNAVVLAQAGSNNVTMRNRIINGNMMINQRGVVDTPVTPTDGQYTVDRWKSRLTQSAKYSVQQSSTAPTGFSNSMLVTSLSAYTLVASDFFFVAQLIEGFNAADLAWGTASAATITVSFWVRSSLTGTFGGCFRAGAVNRSYPFTYTINSANTWEQKTITIPGDTSGSWPTNNTAWGELDFAFGAGSTFSGTAGVWSGLTYVSATGATSVVGTNGATFYVTGVQLEKGSTATPFEQRLYGTELALCQRYYAKMSSVGNFGNFGSGIANSSSSAQSIVVKLPVTMRTQPTPTLSNLRLYDGNAAISVSSITGASATDCSTADTLGFDVTGGQSFLTTGRPVVLQSNNTTAGFVAASAEL